MKVKVWQILAVAALLLAVLATIQTVNGNAAKARCALTYNNCEINA